MPLAIFGIENSTLNVIVTLLVLVLVAIWLALIAFTVSDARRRISDPFLVICAGVAALFPFIGTLVYTILRPPELLEDARERDADIRRGEIEIRHLEHAACERCGTPVESDFLRCPACRNRLKQPCPECSRPVGTEWKVCPYCETTLIEPRRSKRPDSRRRKADPEKGRSEDDRKPVDTKPAGIEMELPPIDRFDTAEFRSEPAPDDRPQGRDEHRSRRRDDAGPINPETP